MAQVQKRCNDLIFEGRPIRVYVSEERPLDKGKIPEDYVGGVNRVVEIEGIDRNPYVMFTRVVARGDTADPFPRIVAVGRTILL